MKKITLLSTILFALCLAVFGCMRPVAAEPVFTPVPLLDFVTELKGLEQVDLAEAERLVVTVDHCTDAEEEQVFTDAATLDRVIAALGEMTVTGDNDGVDSSASVYGFHFEDAAGETLLSISFQDDEELLLLGVMGRYPIAGEEALLGLDGIRLEREDWRA